MCFFSCYFSLTSKKKNSDEGEEETGERCFHKRKLLSQCDRDVNFVVSAACQQFQSKSLYCKISVIQQDDQELTATDKGAEKGEIK